MTEDDPRQLLVHVVRILNRLRIPYVVTGGIAVLVWGRPRFTADIDIVIELAEKDIRRFRTEFKKYREGYLDEDMIRDAVQREDEFNFIDAATGVKVDFWVRRGRNPFDVSQFARKVPKKILGKTIYFISPEDLILKKLKWHQASDSSRQIEDVASILAISGEQLDMRYLEQWAKKLGVWEILREQIHTHRGK